MKNFIIRKATLDDVDFIVETIISAEKSGTEKGGLAALFNLSENDFRAYLKGILEEEIDGCEFSLSSFLVIDIHGKVIAAIGGWTEGINEDNLSSAILKANLLGYYLPQENLKYGFSKLEVFDGFQVQREKGAYQIDDVYVSSDYRGLNLAGFLLEAHAIRAKELGCSIMQLQVSSTNIPAIKCYEKAGFKVVKEFFAKNIEILKFYPSNKKYLMQKNINDFSKVFNY